MPKGLQLLKETDLRRAIKTFQKLGLPIARAEIDRDGKIVVVVGEGKTVLESTFNEWEGAEFAGIRFCGRYWGQRGHDLLRRICPLLTQSGHRSAPEADPSRTPV